MKHTTKSILAILLTMIIVGVVDSSALLRRSKTKRGECENVWFKPAKIPGNIDNTKDIYPTDLDKTTYATAYANALTQTTAARKFFYKPGDAAKKMFKDIASSLIAFLAEKKNGVMDILTNDNGVIIRQAQDRGTWSYFDVINGINDEITEENKISGETPVKLLTKEDFHNQVIKDVADGKGTPRDHLGFIGLLGDIGASVQDIIGKEEDKTKETEKAKIADAFLAFFQGTDGKLEAKCKEYFGNYSPNAYYDDDIKKPTVIGKQLERGSCSVKDTKTNAWKPELKKDIRGGVMGTGDEADKALATKKSLVIPKVGWPWQTVPKKLIDYCKDEPWAGHYSGSFYELFLMFEVFSRSATERKTNAPLGDKEKKKLYAGTAAAFLLATGMHTAVEVNYVLQQYLANPTKFDKEDLKSTKVCTHNATTAVSTIIGGITATKKRKLI